MRDVTERGHIRNYTGILWATLAGHRKPEALGSAGSPAFATTPLNYFKSKPFAATLDPVLHLAKSWLQSKKREWRVGNKKGTEEFLEPKWAYVEGAWLGSRISESEVRTDFRIT